MLLFFFLLNDLSALIKVHRIRARSVSYFCRLSCMQEANSFSRLVFHFSHCSLSFFPSEVTTASYSLPQPVPPLLFHSRTP